MTEIINNAGVFNWLYNNVVQLLVNNFFSSLPNLALIIDNLARYKCFDFSLD